MEKRFQLTEVRSVKNGDKRTITGYAARYNVLSGDLGEFRERIASGAFKRILGCTLTKSAFLTCSNLAEQAISSCRPCYCQKPDGSDILR